MISLDEEALICDLFETYNIFDYKGLPLQKVAILSCGLRDNSRIKMRMSNLRVDVNTLLLSIIADHLALNTWSKTKDATKGRNRPKSIFQKLSENTNNSSEVVAFATAEEFEKARLEILAGRK